MSKRIMNETELANAVESLPKHIKPQRDLWPGINSRLEPQRGNAAPVAATPLWRMPAIAAAVLLALTTGILIGRGIDTPPTGQMSILEYSLAGTVETTERE